jgi:Zn-dependent peptidase ImmA (M78 family)
MLTKIDANIQVKEKPLKYGLKGLYKNGKIIIDKELSHTEKACILAEELGHHYTSVGNIIDQSNLNNRRQERKAREWAHQRLIPLTALIKALNSGARNYHELAEFLGVTEEFLRDAVERYHEKYGVFHVVGEYTIYFSPLGLLKRIEIGGVSNQIA